MLSRTTFSALLAQLPPILSQTLEHVASIAQQQQISLWLVGGIVRDILMGNPIDRDLDLVIEGDAVALAHKLATTLNGQIVATHQTFGTASVTLTPTSFISNPSGTDPDSSPQIVLDLAMARSETYPSPAALPLVTPATIAQDLDRRDFAINAMAVAIAATSRGLEATSVLDPFNGASDIPARVLRVLHPQSFVDDPTRILRGLRLAARIGFSFAPATRSLLNNALQQGMLEATSPDRIRTELCLALDEPRPDEVLRLGDELGITPHIFATLQWNKTLTTRLTQALPAMQHSPQASLLAAGLLTYELPQTERETLITRYRLPNDVARLLRDIGKLQTLREPLAQTTHTPSKLDHLLHPFCEPALQVAQVAEPPGIQAAIDHYLSFRQRKPILNGHDLQQLGVAPGPELGQLLKELRAARLDGVVSNRSEEEAWVLARLNNDR
jgi:tRNA nucleotidyltransferase (CCA-adding enzyme)